MRSTDDLVREFHEQTGQAVGRPGSLPDLDLIRHRIRLIKEEYKEVNEELTELLVYQRNGKTAEVMETLALLLKEMCDLRYVLDGTAVAFGLPFEEAYRATHASNMSKRFPDGTFHTDPKGKVLKGPNYRPVDMERLVPRVLDHSEDPED
jgi:predicted HAD superfamily Cof-like phosphohydrolase